MRSLVLFTLCAGALAAEPQRLLLVQELIRAEAMEKKTVVLFPLEQQGAQLEVKFASKQGGEGVRMAVYSKGSNQPLAGTTYELNGEFRLPIERDREYRVELENMRQRLGHALVDVEVTLVFGARPEAPPASAAHPLDPQRRFYTILTSLSLFGLMVGYAAIRLTPSILQRWRGDI
eukprot:TRINITY_DN21639_c0_g1_i3.p2 TRINITY_DN21639_c0_g1~~TRINITY_DN21639_c0_g1_i3.p2  ORF type:complete len:176 (-),score=46.74 TRINITY_DN21639_c0_g1_i3:25-552(-)